MDYEDKTQRLMIVLMALLVPVVGCLMLKGCEIENEAKIRIEAIKAGATHDNLEKNPAP